jgi:uncharacterized membrane protein
MIHTDNHITIDAPGSTIFELAQNVGLWPDLLPHYRYVWVVSDEPGRRLVRMGARRGPIPVRWTSEQAYDPVASRIVYRHTAGLTRGMEVEWRIVRRGAYNHVSIRHDLVNPRGLLRVPFAARVAASLFIRPIAQNTLRWIKAHAESGQRTGLQRESRL